VVDVTRGFGGWVNFTHHDETAPERGLQSTGSVDLVVDHDRDEVAHVLESPEAGRAATRGGVIRVGSYFLNGVLGALGSAFMYRHLGTKNTGTYVTAVTIAGIVAGLSDLGLTTLGTRELAVRDRAGRARLMRSLVGLRLGLTVVGTGLSVGLSVLVGYQPVLVAGVALAGVGLLLGSFGGTLSLSLVSRLRFGLLTAIATGQQAVITAFTILLAMIGAGVLGFISLPIPIGFVFLIITVWLVPREVPLLPRFDSAEWRMLLREIAPFALASTIAVVYFRLSVVAVSLTASATQLSYFGLSFRILEVLVVIPGIMVTTAFPIFARSAMHDRERLAYGVSRVFIVSLIVGVWFTLTLTIGAPIAIKLLGGEAFSKATGVLRIQAFGLGASFVGALWGMVMVTLRLYRQLILLSLVSLVAGVALVTVLASTNGAQGAALGTAITEVAGALFAPFVLLRYDRQIVPSMAGVPRIALAGGLAALVALIPGVPVIALVAVATVVYFAILVVTRAIPDELLHELSAARRHFALRRLSA
jgi:O-antigen/teichoic acid export membrane protein